MGDFRGCDNIEYTVNNPFFDIEVKINSQVYQQL